MSREKYTLDLKGHVVEIWETLLLYCGSPLCSQVSVGYTRVAEAWLKGRAVCWAPEHIGKSRSNKKGFIF